MDGAWPEPCNSRRQRTDVIRGIAEQDDSLSSGRALASGEGGASRLISSAREVKEAAARGKVAQLRDVIVWSLAYIGACASRGASGAVERRWSRKRVAIRNLLVSALGVPSLRRFLYARRQLNI